MIAGSPPRVNGELQEVSDFQSELAWLATGSRFPWREKEKGPKRKSLPREEVRQAFEKNRTMAGRRSAIVPVSALGGGGSARNSKLCGRRCIASMI